MDRSKRGVNAPEISPQLVWDNHLCLPMELSDNLASLDYLYKLKDAGVDVVSINIAYGAVEFDHAITVIKQMQDWFQNRCEAFSLPLAYSDLLAAHRDGKLSVVFDVEGSKIVEDDLSRIPMLSRLGVRWMSLVYNRNCKVGGGCHDEDRGLTSTGKSVVAQLNKAGITVCVSHAGDRTALEVCAMSERPVMLSHSNPRGFHNHPRNASDEVVRAVADTGGLIGINGVNAFLGLQITTAKAIASAADYAANLVGRRAICLGLDYPVRYVNLELELRANSELFPAGFGYDNLHFYCPEQTPRIGDELRALGWSANEVQGLLGGNLVEFARRNWVKAEDAVAGL